jgi:hypothetical protein
VINGVNGGGDINMVNNIGGEGVVNIEYHPAFISSFIKPDINMGGGNRGGEGIFNGGVRG